MGWDAKEIERLLNIYVKKDELLLATIKKMDESGAFADHKIEQA